MQTKTKQKGFTLVEVMVVIAIVGIVAAIATPAMLNALPNMRLRSAARDIYGIMSTAKVEAIKRGVNVTVLFNSPGDSYIMFLDNGAGGGAAVANDKKPNGAEPVLVALTALPNRVTFDPGLGVGGTAFADGVNFNGNVLVFSPNGIPINDFPVVPGTVGLRATDSNGNTLKQRTVTVSIAGRISIQ